MRQPCAWLFSVKQQAPVLLAALALAAVPFLGGAVIAGSGGMVVHGAQCVYNPATGGCGGPETGGGGCAGTVCAASSSANTPQNTGAATQTIDTAAQNVPSTQSTSSNTSAETGGVCIMPETITAPVATPGVGYPATGAYAISSAAAGKITVCQANGELEFSGAAGAAIVVSRAGVNQTVTLDSSGAGTLLTNLFPH